MLNKPVWVVIPAAGVGQRMQTACPKQYLPLQGKCVLEHTIDHFIGHPDIQGIVVVTSATDPYWPDVAQQFDGFPVHQTIGAETRAHSVLNGLDYLAEHLNVADHTVVLVHDAARPCLDPHDLNLLLAAVNSCAESGALLATPVRDTMKRAQADSRNTIAYTESRTHLWHALTPQLAGLQLLRRALRHALQQNAEVTDEASALEYMGLHPRLLEGRATNIKITRPADLALAEFFLQQRLDEEEA